MNPVANDLAVLHYRENDAFGGVWIGGIRVDLEPEQTTQSPARMILIGCRGDAHAITDGESVQNFRQTIGCTILWRDATINVTVIDLPNCF